MTDTAAPGRANQLGNPCPPWCASDHDHLMPSGKPQQNHYGPELYLRAAAGYSMDARLQQSGFNPKGRPRLHLYAWHDDADAAGGSLEVESAEHARALARLALVVQRMHDGQIAELAAALEAMAAALPPESEL